ncbi:MAG: HNH endonuclease [Phycisphaerae bacterium]|nr:HNH endonuclease [Phycisphaerae bacterium]
MRRRVLAEEPWCRLWVAPATEVNHVTPLRRGGTNARDNLQPLCKVRHSRKTARRDGGFGNMIPDREGRGVG